MSLIKNIILISVLAFGLSSCKDNNEKRKEIVSDKIEQLSKNKADWDSLTQRILKDPFAISNQGKFTNPNDLDSILAKELSKKGIKRFSIKIGSDCKEVEYETEWTEYPIGTLYLVWTTCENSKQTEKGYYKDNSDSNFTEVWGIGNNWLIWTDSDII